MSFADSPDVKFHENALLYMAKVISCSCSDNTPDYNAAVKNINYAYICGFM